MREYYLLVEARLMTKRIVGPRVPYNTIILLTGLKTYTLLNRSAAFQNPNPYLYQLAYIFSFVLRYKYYTPAVVYLYRPTPPSSGLAYPISNYS